MPSPQDVTVTVRDVPESAPGSKTQPDAEPVLEKSPAATPVTDSEKVNVKVNELVAVGVDCADENDETVGLVTSRVIVVEASATEAGPVFPAVSVASLTANRGMIVPSPHDKTVTVRDVPESVPGANTQPDAEPAFEKSPAATPVTDSEKVNVNVNDEAFVGVDCAEANDDTEGFAVSMVTEMEEEAVDVLPAVSVWVADIE